NDSRTNSLAKTISVTEPTSGTKPRIIVMSDTPPLDGIPGGEPGPADKKSDLDDLQSWVRFLSYANEFQIEGLVAASATFANYANKQNILDLIDRYAQVHPNLLLHDPSYLSPDSLRAMTKEGLDGTWGSPANSILGAGKDTEASEHIISVVDRADPTPVWIVSWGGPRELGQALWKVQNTRSPAEVQRFTAKIRVHLIGDQDGSAAWMRSNFPGLSVISNGCYTGMANRSGFNGTWLRANVIGGHGALGAAYPPANWNYNNERVYEGDSPSFLHVLNGTLGLGDPLQPVMGGWGGSFQSSTTNRWTCSAEGAGSISRWEYARNWDFAARMDWMVRPYSQANHNPVAHLNGDASRNVITVDVAAGSTVPLNAVGSTDPDGNSLSYKWLQYPVTNGVTLVNSTSDQAYFVAPNAPGARIYIVLEVTDSGSPSLTSYRRLVVNIR
ncbi:nucleoside hydrolase-like domain-containing protein, partial [Micromonospora sp. LOL_023]|uniref:DUF1593 domain-containing protein n=1 Tax=Micromonospora sp. LOL_023 TaxID=3345418 RepID=UPI003A8C39EE